MRPLLAALLLGATPSVFGQTTPVVQMQVDPAPPPPRPLRHALVYELRDATPGNAAPLYEKVVAAMDELTGGTAGGDRRAKLDHWAVQEPAGLDRKAVRLLLAEFAGPLKLLDDAARCEVCDFGLAERLRREGVSFDRGLSDRLPEAAGVLALRCRLEVAEGDFDAALRTLRTGLSLARHLGGQTRLGPRHPAPHVAHKMLDEIELLIGQPGAPSLAAALAALPPLVDHRTALEGDRLAVWSTFPGLLAAARDPAGKPLAGADLDVCVRQLVGFADPGSFGSLPAVLRGPLLRQRLARHLRRHHDDAKRALVADGRSAAVVEGMSHVQVALLRALGEFDRDWDEVLLLERQPLHRAWPRVEELERRLSPPYAPTPSDADPVRYYVGLLAPSPREAWQARLQLEARVAALRCVEAVRLYAALHGGRPPATLAAVTAVPVPDDPATGRPFLYKVSGRTATLEAGGAEGEGPGVAWRVQYEVTLRGR